MENEKGMDEAVGKLYENKDPILMYKKGVPLPALKAFQKMSYEEFNGNYGFTLKFLVDFYNGIINAISPELESRIELMERRVQILENSVISKTPEPQKPKGIMNADGTVLEMKQ